MHYPAKRNTRPNSYHYSGYGPQLLTDGDMEAGLGSELLTDGDMEAVGTAAYGIGNGAALTKEVGTPHGGSQCLRVTYLGGSQPYATQVVTTIGKSYHITGWARSDGAAAAYPQVRDGATVLWDGTTSTSWQEFSVDFVAVDTTLRLYSRDTTAGQYCEFDDVSVKETCPDWTGVNNPLVTKETGSPGGSGSQVLRVAYNAVNNPYVSQLALVVGRSHRITGWVRGDGTAYPRVYCGAQLWNGTSSTAWQRFSLNAVPSTVNVRLYTMVSAAGYCEFDDITVTEVNTSPDEAIQNASHNLRLIDMGTDEASNVFTYITKGPADTGFWLDWGDGSDREWVQHTGTSDSITTNHTYGATVGFKPIIWEGVLSDITYFYCAEPDNYMNIAAFSCFKKLVAFTCRSSSDITGNIAAMANCTELLTLLAYNTGVSGDVSGLTPLTSLVNLRLSGTSVAYTTTTLPAWAGDIQLQDCGWSEGEVDNFLVDLDTAGGSNGTLDISGTNAAPSATGTTARTSLLGKGWTVTVS